MHFFYILFSCAGGVCIAQLLEDMKEGILILLLWAVIGVLSAIADEWLLTPMLWASFLWLAIQC